MGLIACLIILGLFAFVVLRGFSRLLGENSLFVMLAASGLLVQFGLQAFINMASTLHLMPTKGMTLPFLSYGGSSLMALALGMGMVLALTRRRVGGEALRSEEHTSELQSLMRISYAVFCLKKKRQTTKTEKIPK